MSKETTGEARPLRYSLVRYHNARTEEDINFGVLVHDPEKNRCVGSWDVNGAVQRAGAVFPGFDGSVRFILELAARDFADQVERHAKDGGLAWLSDRHTVCIRVTEPREVAGTEVGDEARQLAAALIPPPLRTTTLRDQTREQPAVAGNAASVFALGLLHALGRPVASAEVQAAARRLNAPFDAADLDAACRALVDAGAVVLREGKLTLP
jgi:hypothetical protein